MDQPSTPTPRTERSAAESSLQSFFEMFARRERTEQELLRSLVSICTIEPHATWQALSLMDQYHRRGVLPTTFYRELKKELNAIAFGDAGTHVSVDGKTFARALAMRTVNMGSADQATANFTADLGTRMKTAMRDLDFFEDADKTASRSFGTPDRGPLTAKSVEGDATASLLTPHAPPKENPKPSVAAKVDIAKTAPVHIEPALVAPAQNEAKPAPSLPIESTQNDSAQARVPAHRVGAVLNERYVLVEPLTSGNISMVFKAFDQQRAALPELERYVAIKCPHANLQNDPRTVAAFRHEYAQSQTILHPNIAKIYDIHEVNGQCFIVMELLQGESLDRLLERIAPRRLPLPRALAIVREIGLALAHAHDHGVVHGNLQANNVTLTRNGEIRVSDFSQSAGWLPPDAPKAQPSDDLYSLACIAHELLCGCLPETTTPEKRPRYAKHLSAQQWRALQTGLADDQGQAASAAKTNHIKRWLADLDLRTAEIRLPALSVLESELDGMGNTALRVPMFAAIALGAVIVLGGIALAWRGGFKPTPISAVSSSPASIAIPSSDPIAAAWANAGANESTTLQTGEAAGSPAPTNDNANSQTVSSPAIAASQLPTVSFTADRYEVNEQEGVVRLVIQRSEPINKKLLLRWFTIAGSAQPGIDYVGLQYASVQLLPGQKSAEISIPLIQGTRHDRDVSFDVRISATGEALPGRTLVAKVIVLPAM